jgi:hypothetical protein
MFMRCLLTCFLRIVIMGKYLQAVNPQDGRAQKAAEVYSNKSE